jgi:hypothetical protein
MLTKGLAFLCVLALPFSVALWFKSHRTPQSHRYDLTLDKSMWVYLKDGICGLNVLSMPTKVASRTEFHTPLRYDARPLRSSFLLSSKPQGPYQVTWIIFPLWLPTGMLTIGCTAPVLRRPAQRWWRKRKGWCLECGYDLTGNRSGRCSECGTRFR